MAIFRWNITQRISWFDCETNCCTSSWWSKTGVNIDELFYNYKEVLQRLLENNLCLAADKTIICTK